MNEPNYNKTLATLREDFNDQVWYDFHAGHIEDSDAFYEYFHNWIDSAVIYTYDCEKILDSNSEYHYLDHDLYGRPNNIHQAAYACLYDYLILVGNCMDIWYEMEEVLTKKEKV